MKNLIAKTVKYSSIIVAIILIFFGVMTVAVGKALSGALLLAAGIMCIPSIFLKISEKLPLFNGKKSILVTFILFVVVIVFPISLFLTETSEEKIEREKKIAEKERTEVSQLQQNDADINHSTNEKEESNEEKVPQSVSVKEKLNFFFINPNGNNRSTFEDIFEFSGTVDSFSEAQLTMTKRGDNEKTVNVPIDAEGKFYIKVNLDKGDNVFDFIAKKENETVVKDINVIRQLTDEEKKEAYKLEAKTVPFKDLFRNIDDYKGMKIHYTGSVVQIMGDGNFMSSMRVNITRGSYGMWDDTVLVSNMDVNSEKILEDDVVEFWGEVVGEESYETVLGAEVTLPSLSAEYIELKS